MVACGGYNNSSPTTSGTNSDGLSHFAKRVLLLNSGSGVISGAGYILDASNDKVYPTPITLAGSVNLIAETPDKKTTLVASPSGSVVQIINNATETTTNSLSLLAPTESIAVLADNKTVIVPVRNAVVSGQPNGAVVIADITTFVVTATISVPEARRVVVNHAGTKILVFADDTNSLYVIDAAAKTATAIPGFDRPVDAVFSSDDSKAYILNCGAECGGSVASVTVFNPSDNSLGANVPVSGATVALFDSNKLYVAGSPNNVGLLDVLDGTTLARTQAGIAIGNGHHTKMALADGGKLYIGAQNCSNQTVSGVFQGCLSIYGTSGSTAVISSVTGPVNGLQPLLGRNLVYVCIGGELVIYDTTTDAPRPSNQFDVVGYASDVKLID